MALWARAQVWGQFDLSFGFLVNNCYIALVAIVKSERTRKQTYWKSWIFPIFFICFICFILWLTFNPKAVKCLVGPEVFYMFHMFYLFYMFYMFYMFYFNIGYLISEWLTFRPVDRDATASKNWSIIKSKDSFGFCTSWGFQNCPWKLNLTKICLS